MAKKIILVLVLILLAVGVYYFFFMQAPTKEGTLSEISQIFSAAGIDLSKGGLLNESKLDSLSKAQLSAIKGNLLNYSASTKNYSNSEFLKDTANVYISYVSTLIARHDTVADNVSFSSAAETEFCNNLSIYENAYNNLVNFQNAAIATDSKINSFISKYGEEKTSQVFILQNRFSIAKIEESVTNLKELYDSAEATC